MTGLTRDKEEVRWELGGQGPGRGDDACATAATDKGPWGSGLWDQRRIGDVSGAKETDLGAKPIRPDLRYTGRPGRRMPKKTSRPAIAILINAGQV